MFYLTHIVNYEKAIFDHGEDSGTWALGVLEGHLGTRALKALADSD